MLPALISPARRQRRMAKAESGGGGGNPAWMATVVPSLNTWGEIPDTAIATAQADPSNPTFSNPGGSGRPGIYAWSAGCVFDKWIIHPAGGGHTDYKGTEVPGLNLGADVPGYVLLLPSATEGNIVENARNNSDDSPTSRHSYNEVWPYHAGSEVRLVGCGSGWGGSPANTWDVRAFNVTSNTWVSSSTYTQATTLFGGLSHQTDLPACQDPATDNVYILVGNNVLVKYTMATDTYTSLMSITWTIVGISGAGACAIDTTRNRLLALSNDATKHRYYTNITGGGSITENTPSIGGSQASKALGNCKLHYIAALDKFLLFRFDSSDANVYQIDPVTFACEVYSVSGTPPNKNTLGGAGFYGRFFHMPELSIVGFYGATSSDNCSVFRYA